MAGDPQQAEPQEPGRTPTHADGSETETFPQEETRTQSKAEGDRETVEESLRQKE